MTSERRQIASVQIPGLGWGALALAGLAGPLLLYLGRHLNFFYDEWTFIFQLNHGLSPDLLFSPHNEHWSSIPYVLYQVLLSTAGLGSYLPYLGALEVLHVGSALLLFLLVRRRSGDLLAIGAMALVLFLGRGAENILWAFQLGFVGSVFFGLLAMLSLDVAKRPPWAVVAASLALLAALMSSGVGVFFLAAIAFDLALDPSRRRYLVALPLPVLAYAGWFLGYGRRGVAAHRAPLTLPGILSLNSYVPYGVGAAISGLFGLSSKWGSAFLAATSGFLAVRWYQDGRIDSRVVGAAGGLLTQFVLTGLVRSQFGDEQAGVSRYVYVAAFFVLLILTDALARVPWRRASAVSLGLVVILVLVYSGIHLRGFAIDRGSTVALQDAELQTVGVFRGAPSLDLDAQVDPIIMPPVTPRAYFSAVDRWGAPVMSVDLAALQRLPVNAVEQAMRATFGPSLSITPAFDMSSPGGCQSYAGEGFIDLPILQGGQAQVTSTAGGSGGMSIWFRTVAGLAPMKAVTFVANQPVVATLPATGQPLTWNLRIYLPASGSTSICRVS